jgi:hypothetical protein
MSDPQTEAILVQGTKIGKDLTAKIVKPLVSGSSIVSGMAGALPPLLAAQGAFLGKLIAVPIQVGAAAGSGLVSGLTGIMVGIPVGFGTGAAVAAHQIKPWLEVMKTKAMASLLEKKPLALPVGHHHLQPVAMVSGHGKGGKGFLLGSGTQLMAAKMQALGALLSKAGLKTSVAAQTLAAHGAVPVIPEVGPPVVPQAMVPLPVVHKLQAMLSKINAHKHGAVAAYVPVEGPVSGHEQVAGPPVAGSSSGAVAFSSSGISAPGHVQTNEKQPVVS